MHIDLTLTITGAIAISAIISPMLTTWLNNRHQAKIKRIENYELAKRQALLDYISASYKCISHKNHETEANFYIALNNLYVYFPNIDDIEYKDLSRAGKFTDINAYSYNSQKVMKSLSKHIKKK